MECKEKRLIITGIDHSRPEHGLNGVLTSQMLQVQNLTAGQSWGLMGNIFIYLETRHGHSGF